MRGTNPIRAPEAGDGRSLFVKEIFSTLQGEGPRAGEPAVFVRLGGCNLACVFCDTEFEDFSSMPMLDIVARVQALAGAATLVVVSGGEPLRQPIAPLCEALLAQGFTVQIETNGTLWRPLPETVEVVCSPKPGNHGYAPLRADVLERALALKYLISTQQPHYAEVPAMPSNAPPIYVQPMDEGDRTQNAANTSLAVALATAHGYRLSLQLHKILGIP